MEGGFVASAPGFQQSGNFSVQGKIIAPDGRIPAALPPVLATGRAQKLSCLEEV
jgi:hypothetical protein